MEAHVKTSVGLESVAALAEGRHEDPFAILGPHVLDEGLLQLGGRAREGHHRRRTSHPHGGVAGERLVLAEREVRFAQGFHYSRVHERGREKRVITRRLPVT
jgi:hypothetical protein